MTDISATHVNVEPDVYDDICAQRASALQALSPEEIKQGAEFTALPFVHIANDADFTARESVLKAVAMLTFGLEQGLYGD